MPEIHAESSDALPETISKSRRALRSQPHFVLAVMAQFLYVAAQAGIFSFFINYMTSQAPPLSSAWASMLGLSADASLSQESSWGSGWFRQDATGALLIGDQGAAKLASAAFICFLLGRFIGAALLRKRPAHTVLAIYAVVNVLLALLVVAKLAWLSVACVFLMYFFMSIMFPTIFALGIQDLGPQTKRASAYLVMAIVGGALVPKLMGYIADQSDIARAFVVPMMCFAFIAYYGFRWPAYFADSTENLELRSSESM